MFLFCSYRFSQLGFFFEIFGLSTKPSSGNFKAHELLLSRSNNTMGKRVLIVTYRHEIGTNVTLVTVISP